MTEKDPEVHVEEDDDELDGKLNYKPPPQKTLQELQELDKDDESLAKYKKSLLGDAPVVAGTALEEPCFGVEKEGSISICCVMKLILSVMENIKFDPKNEREVIIYLFNFCAAISLVKRLQVTVLCIIEDQLSVLLLR